MKYEDMTIDEQIADHHKRSKISALVSVVVTGIAYYVWKTCK